MKGILKKRKSYLRKIYLYLLAVLMIPILLTIMLNIKTKLVIKEQILLSNKQVMEQIILILEEVILEMKENCIVIARDENVLNYANTDIRIKRSIPYERYEIVQKLKNYVNEKTSDVFVYYPHDDYVVSGWNGAMTSYKYYQAFYGGKEDFLEDFLSNLNCNSGYPVFKVMNFIGEKTYLCVSMMCFSEVGKNKFIVSVVFNPEYLKQLLEENNISQGSIFLLFDENKELLFSSDKKKVNYNMEDFFKDKNIFEESLDGDNIMQLYRSESLRGYYAFVVKKQFIEEQFKDINIYSIISILISIGIGLFLVFIMSRKAYEPVRKITNLIINKRRDFGIEIDDMVEFDFLEMVILEDDIEKRNLEKKIKESKAEMRERFLYQLFEGTIFEIDKGDNIFEFYDIFLCSNLFLVGIICCKEMKHEKDLQRFIICNVLEEIFNQENKGYIMSVTEEKYVFLLNLSRNNDKEQVKEMLIEGKEFLEKKCGIVLTIGYSNIHEGVQEISMAYKEAMEALQYKYILGTDMMIDYEYVKGREFTYLDISSARISFLLENYVNNFMVEQTVAQFISELFVLFKINEKVSLETVECFKFDIVNAINRIGVQCGYTGEERKNNIKELLNANTITEFEKKLSEIVSSFGIKKLELKKDNGICEQTKLFIEENYFDTQLSLSFVCEAMNMSTSYLSKIYKNKYGISIVNDITNIRLKKAKDLLKNTDLNIAEISNRTGFSNSNVFIKVFKKYNGITPGQYRELNDC